MRGTLVGIALTAGVIASPALAQESWVLSPSSEWTLDYADDSCLLRRMFGTGNDQVFLEFRRFGPGAGMYALVSSKLRDARRPPRFRYRFGEAGDWRDTTGLAVSGEGFSGVIFGASLVQYPVFEDPVEREAYFRTIDAPALELERAAAVSTIVLRGAFRRDLKLELGNLAAPLRALNDCVDELVTHWNIDIEAHKTLTRRAAPVDLADSSSMLGYPPAMLRRNMPGLVNVRLAIDETGKITGCHIQMPLSDPEFEASSCADIQHAFEFTPALDKDGKPIASYWLTTVRFTLGGF